MNFTTAPLSWHWGIIFLVCSVGAIALGRKSQFYPLFWWPLMTLGGICTFTLFKSWGAGPRDGPSGLVVLFTVFPVIIVSLLGIGVGLVCWRKHPTKEASKPLIMGCGILISGLALLFTTRAEIKSVTVRVFDGYGKFVDGIVVDAKATDEMTRETSKQAVTDSEGIAHFEFAKFRTISVSASAQNCYRSRATYGGTGFGRKGWQLWWDGLGTMLLPEAFNPETVVLYLRGTDELILQKVKERMAASLSANLNDNDTRYALATLGTNFESFEIMNLIPASGAIRQSYDTLLINQAELIEKCFQELDSKVPRDQRRFSSYQERSLYPSGWSGLARWAGIPGKNILVTPDNLKVVDQFLVEKAQKLLDAAKLTLASENPAAGVYSMLRFIARHRLPEIKDAYQHSNNPRAKRLIYDALRNFKPSFNEIESLIANSDPMEAIQLLMCVSGDKDWDDYQRAKAYFEKLDSQPHPLPAPSLEFNNVEVGFQQMRQFYAEADQRWAKKR